MDSHFDELCKRVLKWLADNGAPFDWRDIDGSDEPEFLSCLQQMEKEKLIVAGFRISGRLGDQGRIVFARVSGITPQGLEYLNAEQAANTVDEAGAVAAHSSLDVLQQLQLALAEQLNQPGALRLSSEALAAIRRTLHNSAGNHADQAQFLNHGLTTVDEAALNNLLIKWIAYPVRTANTASIAVLLGRLAATGKPDVN